MGLEPPLPLAPVYEQLIAGCPVLSFPERWNFVPPNADCRGAVSDPPGTLAALRADWGTPALEAAGVIQRLPDGELRLHPGLCDPRAVIDVDWALSDDIRNKTFRSAIVEQKVLFRW